MAVAEEIVVSRIARFSYGFSHNVLYEPASPEHRSLGIDRIVWDKAEQQYMATGKMNWIIRRVRARWYHTATSSLT